MEKFKKYLKCPALDNCKEISRKEATCMVGPETNFNCYSGLCWHKNWFADLNRYVSVSQYNMTDLAWNNSVNSS